MNSIDFSLCSRLGEFVKVVRSVDDSSPVSAYARHVTADSRNFNPELGGRVDKHARAALNGVVRA